MTTRDELVALCKGDIVGGNVVKNNVCYGRSTEGVFTLTEEGKALVAEANVPAPTAKKAVKKPIEPKNVAPLDLDLE